MNKKFSVFILLLVCIFALTGCRKIGEAEPVPTAILATATPEPTPEPLPEGVAYAEELIELGILGEREETVDIEPNAVVDTELPAELEVLPDPEMSEAPVQEEIPEEEIPSGNNSCCEYGAYLAMSSEEQETYMNSFETTMDFIAWSQSASAVHQEHVISADEAGAVLDISQFIHG